MLDLTGRTLGQYRITAKIGEGGMAVVFRAYQPGLDRDVAIKVLPPSFAQDSEFAKRFQREAQSIALLNHPNILPVYDFGVDRGYTYIAMRYVEGSQTLNRLISQSLGQERAVELIAQVGNALAYAHKQGVIHRDVKPSNVLVDDNWPLLADFGLAKVGQASTNLTKAGKLLGTPRYMSPEQLEGQVVDHRADIYALGIILYQMLTGIIPHDADTPLVIMHKRSTQPPSPPRNLNPDIPKNVEQVILHALAIDPQDRYNNTEEFVHALQHALVDDESTVASMPIRSTPFPGKKLSTNRLLKRWLVWVVIVVAGFIGIGTFVWGREDLTSPTPQPNSAQTASIPIVAPDPTSTPTATFTSTSTSTSTPTHTPMLPTATPSPSPTPSSTPSPSLIPSATNTPLPETPTTIPTNTSIVTSTPTVSPTPIPVSVDVPAAKLVEYNGEAFSWEWTGANILKDVDWYFDIKIYDNSSAEIPSETIIAEPHKTGRSTDGTWSFMSGPLNLKCDSFWVVQIAERTQGSFVGWISPESDRLPIGSACGGSDGDGDDGGNGGGIK